MVKERLINTDTYSELLRERSIDMDNRRIMVTLLRGSGQESDLSAPTNCDGVGRIRHFSRHTNEGWPSNPLPIEPACAALGLPTTDLMEAQVFQNAACNWRCWYCYVPFQNLAAKEALSRWLIADELVSMYASEQDRPQVIVLSGGQPDLVPEWTLWMMQSLEIHELADSTYLWVDDNLSTDYFWRYLSREDVGYIAGWRNYGRVGCFKGFDQESFAFNTKADPSMFERQFDLFERQVQLGVDCYAYATITSPNPHSVARGIPRFIDQLQQIHEALPLRTVPLEIEMWGPVHDRMNSDRVSAMQVQQEAIAAWTSEMSDRFSPRELSTPINRVDLR